MDNPASAPAPAPAPSADAAGTVPASIPAVPTPASPVAPAPAVPAAAAPPPVPAGETASPVPPATESGQAPVPAASADGAGAAFYEAVAKAAAKDPRLTGILEQPESLVEILAERDEHLNRIAHMAEKPVETIVEMVGKNPQMVREAFTQLPPEATQALTEEVLRKEWSRLSTVRESLRPPADLVNSLREALGDENIPVAQRQAIQKRLEEMEQPGLLVLATMHGLESALAKDKARTWESYMNSKELANFWENPAPAGTAPAESPAFVEFSGKVKQAADENFKTLFEKHVQLPAGASAPMAAAVFQAMRRAVTEKMNQRPGLAASLDSEATRDMYYKRDPAASQTVQLVTREQRRALLEVQKEVLEAFFPAVSAAGAPDPGSDAGGTAAGAPVPGVPAAYATQPTRAQYTVNGIFDDVAFQKHAKAYTELVWAGKV